MGSLSLRPGDSLTIPRTALSVGFIRFVSSDDATQATGFRLFPRWDSPPTEHASLSLVALGSNYSNALKDEASMMMHLDEETQVARLLAYVTGLLNQQLLLQNEYLIAENRILRSHLPARVRLTDPQRATIAAIGKRLGRQALEHVALKHRNWPTSSRSPREPHRQIPPGNYAERHTRPRHDSG